MEEISRDLEAEVSSAAAQMYRDRLNIAEEGEGGGNNNGLKAEPLQALQEEPAPISIDLETTTVAASPLETSPTAVDRLETTEVSTPSAEQQASSATTTSKRPKSSEAAMRKRFEPALKPVKWAFSLLILTTEWCARQEVCIARRLFRRKRGFAETQPPLVRQQPIQRAEHAAVRGLSFENERRLR